MANLTGDRNTTCPSKVPHRYCVMDWFKVTHAWAEKEALSGYVRYKFRFEKLDFSTDGWWAVEESVIAEDCAIASACCRLCREESPCIYGQGWMCLGPACPKFWKVRLDFPSRYPEASEYSYFLTCVHRSMESTIRPN